MQQPLCVKCIQPIKIDLARRGLLDTILKSNLDFAMEALEVMSITKKKNALLQVEGEKTLLKINSGQPVIHHIVWNDNGNLKLLQKINIKDTKLTKENIDKSHFLGHCCRDEVKSCMMQAYDEVASKNGELANVELKIMCGEFLLTYITQDPSTTILIQPDWRVKMTYPNLNTFLKTKNCMEKAGEMSPGMLACFKLLLEHPKLEKKSYCEFLVSKGQKVEFVYDKYVDKFTIICDEDQAKIIYTSDFH